MAAVGRRAVQLVAAAHERPVGMRQAISPKAEAAEGFEVARSIDSEECAFRAAAGPRGSVELLVRPFDEPLGSVPVVAVEAVQSRRVARGFETEDLAEIAGAPLFGPVDGAVA